MTEMPAAFHDDPNVLPTTLLNDPVDPATPPIVAVPVSDTAPLAPSVVNAPVPAVVAPTETPFSVPPVKAMLEPSRRLVPR